jgi:nucleoside-diphosphate-sugar epimerase
MDFIYIKDLFNIVNFILNNNVIYNDINCTYVQKYSLLDIAHIILTVTQKNLPIIIENNGITHEYTLDGELLNSLNIPMIGLENGIQEMYKEIKLCL